MDFEDLSDKGIERAFQAIFLMLVKQGNTLTPARRRSLLQAIEYDLDEGDESDEFGTEGWAHAAGLD